VSNSQAIVSGNLRAAMARREVSQAELAEALGLPQTAVSRRLRNIVPWSLPELEAAAERLEVSMAQLIIDPFDAQIGA
jgi:transcriptional regulator with XRE-family HTH domain